MAKDRSFASKTAKTGIGGLELDHCDVCGKTYDHVKQVVSVKSERTGAWKFNERSVLVCDCNRQEVMG